MNRWLKKRKARGFTLVELLIVIVIIGILAGSMLLVFGSSTDSAKAARVVSELRSLKAAALMHYADNAGWPDAISDLKPYMDRNPATGEYCDYEVTSGESFKVASGDSGSETIEGGTWIRTEGLASSDLNSIFIDATNSSPTEKAKEAGVGVLTSGSGSGNEIGMILER